MLTHKGTQEIRTERLLLRRFRGEDAKRMFDTWANDERVTQFLTWTPHGSIGCVETNERDECGEIGYCIAYNFWSKGIMTEATSAVIDFLFSEVNFHRIEILHATQNPASGKVAQHCGLTLEGIKREHFKSATGEFLDIAIYSILKKEWENKR